MPRHRYTSDSHFGHTNIIRYCQRPFSSVAEMDAALATPLIEADAAGDRIVHLGDWAWKAEEAVQCLGQLSHPEQHLLVTGNHDRYPSGLDVRNQAFHQVFGTIIGERTSWMDNQHRMEDTADGRTYRLLLSHVPRPRPEDVDLVLFGHIHNSASDPLKIERVHLQYPWLEKEPAHHVNVGVDVLGFKPRSLEWILRRKKADPTSLI